MGSLGRSEGPQKDSGSSSSIQAPVHSNLEGETLQLERGSSGAQGNSTPLEEPINPDEYVCGRGDVFELNFWGAQNFKVRLIIDSEARAFIPKVGYVDVANRTLAQARASVKKAVARFYPGLNFDMSLLQPRSFRIHIVGFVDKPGLYTSNPVERISVVLDRAMLTPRGSSRRIDIKRRDGRKLTADLLRYEQTGDRQFNPYVMDGDIITVPFADTVVSINGATERNGKFELIGSKNLAELLELAGGYRSDVTHSLPIRVTRRGPSEKREQLSVPFGASGATTEVALHDGDAVAVPTVSELQSSILIIGPVPGSAVVDEITSTKRVPFVAGSSVRAVLEDNGPLGASADLKSAYIRGENGAFASVDLEAILVRRDFSQDRQVQAGDTIVIPQKRLAVSVEGAVFKPGIYPYNLRFTSDQYISVAGGPSRLAQPRSNYRIIAADGKIRPMESSAGVQPGDTLLLPERSFTRSEIVQLVMGSVGLALSAAAIVVVVILR